VWSIKQKLFRTKLFPGIFLTVASPDYDLERFGNPLMINGVHKGTCQKAKRRAKQQGKKI
jgi:hypothetical protein